MTAVEFINKINENQDKHTRYKDNRPITDLKDMLKSSAKLYPSNVAFWTKKKRGVKYEPITYTKAYEDVNALGTALIANGMKDKRIAVIGENSYNWAISYLATVCGTGIIVPLDKELNQYELMQLVVNAEVSCVLFDDKYEKMFKSMKDSGETVLKLLINMDE